VRRQQLRAWGRTRTVSRAALTSPSCWRLSIAAVKVMVVDDEPAMRDALELALRLDGFDVA
jgi:hypothetical protein